MACVASECLVAWDTFNSLFHDAVVVGLFDDTGAWRSDGGTQVEVPTRESYNPVIASNGSEFLVAFLGQPVSGMPAEVFMQTGSRTMMSYLLKPITDQLQRAFVER